jgi:hypothetical protein
MEEGVLFMKRTTLLSAIILIVLAPLACNKNWHVAPLPAYTFTPTSTVTPTPNCGFGGVSISDPLTPFPTPEIRWVPTAPPVPTRDVPSNWSTPDVVQTPTPSVVAGHDPFLGTVIRTLSEWQSYYGTMTPPVDFDTQTLLVYITDMCCFGSRIISNVCETSDEVQVTMTIPYLSSWGCDLWCSLYGAVAIPKTNLPVYITQFIWTNAK